MELALRDGARVGVVGGGPAGSMFAYFLLTFAKRMDLKVGVDIYEPREFTKPGPAGCNMCGGIVSESLVQSLAIEGIQLPDGVVQRGIDSYVLHSDESSVRITTPLEEARIAALHRGGGPRDVDPSTRIGGLDGYLLGLAQQRGANVVAARVGEARWAEGRPQLIAKEISQTYDLVVGAVGVNSTGWKLFEQLGIASDPPKTTKTYITEVKLGADVIAEHFGSSMHLFLLDIPRLDCAALIPKGDYLTVCLLGQEIDKELIGTFFASEPVRRCFPPSWEPEAGVCRCSPKINVVAVRTAFLDRVVLVGDCGVTRLYKDGIGAAYRAAKAAARTAVFNGVSAAAFKKHYQPLCRSIDRDNQYGKFMFGVTHHIKGRRSLVRGVLQMTEKEQRSAGKVRRMSVVLWDMFTGSSPYRTVFFRTLDPRFIARFGWEIARALGRSLRSFFGRRLRPKRAA